MQYDSYSSSCFPAVRDVFTAHQSRSEWIKCHRHILWIYDIRLHEFRFSIECGICDFYSGLGWFLSQEEPSVVASRVA